MIKEKPSVIINKAKELSLYQLPAIKLWVTGTKMRRTFGGGIPNAADLLTGYLTENDDQYLIGTKKTMKGSSTFYHLAPTLELYAEVQIIPKGAWSSVYNPANFMTEIRFHTKNPEHIKTVVKGVNELWVALGRGPMLDNMVYPRYQKKLGVTPEQIKQAWQKWSSLKQSTPSTSAPPTSPTPSTSPASPVPSTSTPSSSPTPFTSTHSSSAAPSTPTPPSSSNPPGPPCSICNRATTWIPQYKRYYCYPCKKYV